jgi:hypothetical protein
MSKKLTLLLVPFMFACSHPSPAPVEPSMAEQIKAEIERIKPLLLVCEGAPADTRANEVTGQERCSTGDSIAHIGFTQFYAPEFDFSSYVQGSIREDGLAFRGPMYLKRGPYADDFSRDQLLGLSMYSVAINDSSLLRLVRDYARGHSWKLCDNDTDNRCTVTPGMRYLVADVLGDKVSLAEREYDKATDVASAHIVPGNYEAFLLAKRVAVRRALGRTDYDAVTQILSSRFPQNMYFRYLSGDDVAEQLLSCLRDWKAPGTHHTFESDTSACESRPEGSIGWEIVALGRAITR